MVDIDIADSCTGLAVGGQIGKLIVAAKGFAVVGCTDAARDIEFLRDNVLPNAVDGFHVSAVTCESGNISHACIHIGRAHSVPYSLILLNDGFMGLRIGVGDGGLATLVEQELSFVEIFTVTCYKI